MRHVESPARLQNPQANLLPGHGGKRPPFTSSRTAGALFDLAVATAVGLALGAIATAAFIGVLR